MKEKKTAVEYCGSSVSCSILTRRRGERFNLCGGLIGIPYRDDNTIYIDYQPRRQGTFLHAFVSLSVSWLCLFVCVFVHVLAVCLWMCECIVCKMFVCVFENVLVIVCMSWLHAQSFPLPPKRLNPNSQTFSFYSFLRLPFLPWTPWWHAAGEYLV